VPIYSVPQAQPGWTPYAAAVPGNSVRTSAELSAQPEPKSALVWLGSGLVGVAGAAGLVFFRLRNPYARLHGDGKSRRCCDIEHFYVL
jgi:hypothetical protein